MRVRKKNDSTESRRQNEQGGLTERKLENLNVEKGKAKNETAHNVCSRQLMDDANRSKCSKCQWKIKRYLLMIRGVLSKMMIEGDEAFAKVFREIGVKKKIMKQ